MNILVTLLICTFTKRIFKRDRPVLPDYEDEKTPNRRTFDVRSHETNYSFPSGDAA